MGGRSALVVIAQAHNTQPFQRLNPNLGLFSSKSTVIPVIDFNSNSLVRERTP